MSNLTIGVTLIGSLVAGVFIGICWANEYVRQWAVRQIKAEKAKGCHGNQNASDYIDGKLHMAHELYKWCTSGKTYEEVTNENMG